MIRCCVACLQNNDVAAAIRFITTAKAELAAQRQKASELKSGMDIFNISQPAYKELTQNEKVSLQYFLRLSSSSVGLLLSQ